MKLLLHPSEYRELNGENLNNVIREVLRNAALKSDYGPMILDVFDPIVQNDLSKVIMNFREECKMWEYPFKQFLGKCLYFKVDNSFDPEAIRFGNELDFIIQCFNFSLPTFMDAYLIKYNLFLYNGSVYCELAIIEIE